MVLQKIENAFAPGDPYLDLATKGKVSQISDLHWIERDEQKKIDTIVGGLEMGRYYLLVGEKGTGKSSMLIEAMQKINGKGVSMLDAHADIEIFRIRLGKAIDFEFHEDNIGKNTGKAPEYFAQIFQVLCSRFAVRETQAHSWT